LIDAKRALIEKLTGIHSSKKTYYTALKKKIQETELRNTQLEILGQLARSINVDMSLAEIMTSVTENLRRVVRFDRLTLYTIEGRMPTARVVIPPDRSPLDLGGDDAAARSLVKTVLLQRRPVLRTDTESGNDRRPEDDWLLSQGLRSAAFVPLVIKDHAVGLLKLACRQPEGCSEGDVLFLRRLADHIAVWLENARLYRQVLRSKVEWEETFAAVTDLLFVVDAGFRVTKANKAVAALAGGTPDETVGVCCHQLLFERDRPCDNCPAQQTLSTGETAYRQVRLPTGQILDVFSYPVFNERRQLYGVTQYAKDVTQLVNSVKFVALGEMAAGVAHELNNPLTAIVGDAQLLLRDTPEDDPRRELLVDIKNCGFRSRRIIQNLLAFSRQGEYSFEPVDLNEVVRRALALVSYQIERSQVQVVSQLHPDLPEIVADGQRLEQVLINLLLNAKDALEGMEDRREVTIRTAPGRHPGRRPEEGDDSERPWVHVAVADTGCGIGEERLTDIFTPFFTTKAVGQGTGLGLSVSLGIVQAHGGRIDVSSTVGQGSTFTVSLPVRPASADREE